MSRLESDYYSYMDYDPTNAKASLSHYVSFFEKGPVLELACGRGEFLELLRDAGVPSEGVDLDEGMVERACALGLQVSHGDAIAALERRGDNTLQGVFSAHFAEHLQPDVLEHVIAESARVLAPGGMFIAATPNAACVSVMGHDFWRDPTHIRFYEPRLLAFYCAKAGLQVVETGGNPGNHPGPPPEALAPEVHVDADLRGDLVAAIQQIQDKKHAQDWQAFGHFLAVLEERLRVTQEELVAVRRSYAHLLDRLYPSNEVYVVARAS